VLLGGDPSHTVVDLQSGRLAADLLVAGTVLKPLGLRNGTKPPETKLTISLIGINGPKIYDSETAGLTPLCATKAGCVSRAGVYLLDQIKLPSRATGKATEAAAQIELWEKSPTAGSKWVAVDTAPIQLPVPPLTNDPKQNVDQPLTPAPDLQAIYPVPVS
jgi:hypothetical protein